MPEQPGDELAFCEQRSASKSARVIGSNTPVKSTRSIVVSRVENNHRARAAHFWTSLLDLTFGPHCSRGRRRAPAYMQGRVACQVGGSGVQRAVPQVVTILKNKIHLQQSQNSPICNLKTLRNWTSPSGAVHFFGPHSLSPFGPHWNHTGEHLYKSRVSCPNWTSLLRVKNSF